MEKESPTVPRRIWFFQGAVVGLLLTGTLNALSYFVRSGGWGSLLGGSAFEAMGFPMQLWAGDGYHVHSISALVFVVNLGFMLGLSAACGLVTTSFSTPLNRLVGSLCFSVAHDRACPG